MIRAGIIGIGLIGEKHALAIAQSEKLKVHSCYHRNIERAHDFAGRHHCIAYNDLTSFLEDELLDLVCICTPSGTHLEIAVQAAEAGKHLVIEKPLEITVERCNEIISAAVQNGVICSGIFQSRFSADALKLKKLVQTGAFGTLVTASAEVRYYREPAYYTGSSWHGTWSLDGGGALMNQSIHAVDLLGWLMGPVKTVTAKYATRVHGSIEVEDTATAVLEFENGALGVIQASTAIYPGFERRIQLSGSDGSATLVGGDFVEFSFRQGSDDGGGSPTTDRSPSGTRTGASDPGDVSLDLHLRQLEDVADAIGNGREPAVTATEATRAVAVIRGIYESARSGRSVAVKYQ